MQILEQAITNVFPGSDVSHFTSGTKLGEIPGWDSMNAINLVLEIEVLSGCKNLQLQFDEELTIAQVAEQLQAIGINA